MEQEIKQLEELLHKVEVFDQEKQVWQALTEKYGSASQVTKEMVRDLIEKLWIVGRDRLRWNSGIGMNWKNCSAHRRTEERWWPKWR